MKKILLSFVVCFGVLINVANAQTYTLTDNDVVVTNGVLRSCVTTSKNIIIPNTLDGQTVTAIGSFAFQYNQLTNVTFGNSLTEIDDYAFQYNQLTNVTFGNSLTTIGDGAFSFNQLTSVAFGNSLTTIGDGAFSNNQLTSVTFGDSLTSIGDFAFMNNQLTSVTLPGNLVVIGRYSFRYNILTSFTLPKLSKVLYSNSLWNGYIYGGTKVTNLEIEYTRTGIVPLENGVYVGLVGFNGNLRTTEEINTDGMLVLNQSGENRNSLNNFVNSLQQDDNTALYAAMGQSVTMLKKATLPKKLEEVFVITFTDGLDNFSQNKTPAYTSTDVQAQIDTALVDFLPITSYTVGFSDGMSPAVKAAFRTDLTNLASNPKNFFASDSFAEITDFFTYISKQLVKVTQINRLECKIPGPADKTQVRWTFDITSTTDLSPSKVYISATVRRKDSSGLSFWLEDVSYNGVSSTSTAPFLGKNVLKNGNFDGVKFSFDDFKFTEKCSDGDISILKYWSFNSGFNLWVNDIESNAGSISTAGFNKKNIAVMLNLDCSNSLGSQFGEIKTMAINFINNLQTDYHSNSATKFITKVNVNPKEPGINVTFGGTTKSTNSLGEVYFFDLDAKKYNYSGTYKGISKGGEICVDGIKEISINFSTKEHTVTFEDWDQTVLKVEFVETGKSATAPNTPSKPNSTFTGWSKDFSNVTEDITITAQYDDMTSNGNISSANGMFSIYPNPTSGTLHIISNRNEPIDRIFITDIAGKVVAAYTASELRSSETNYVLQVDLPTGMYYLNVESNHSMFATKLIKE